MNSGSYVFHNWSMVIAGKAVITDIDWHADRADGSRFWTAIEKTENHSIIFTRTIIMTSDYKNERVTDYGQWNYTTEIKEYISKIPANRYIEGKKHIRVW